MLRWQLKITRSPHCPLSWTLNLDNVQTLFWCDFYFLDTFKVLDIINKIDNDSGCLDFKVLSLSILSGWSTQLSESHHQLPRSFAMFSLTCITTTTLSKAIRRHLGFCEIVPPLSYNSASVCDFPKTQWKLLGCSARMRRGPYQLMRSSEAFWFNLSNFISIFCKNSTNT